MRVGIVAVEYAEPYYEDTRQCILAAGLPVVWVPRSSAGVGSLTASMNKGFRAIPPGEVDLVWFLTDVMFPPDMPAKLAECFTDDRLWAIHPAHPSDHPSHQPNGSGEAVDVPYVEFTAPMIRYDVFKQLGGLDEDHWYWYQDLVFSKQIRDAGGRMAVDHGSVLQHVYRRNQATHPVTVRRYYMRKQRDHMEQQLLRKKYGENWREILWAKT